MQRPDPVAVVAQVGQALAEDIGSGDLTAALVPEDAMVRARVVVREAAILCGRAWFEEVFRQLDPAIELVWSAEDGDAMEPGQPACELAGKARPILSG